MKHFGLALCLFLLVSCETTVQPDDTDPPTITISLRTQGVPLIYTSDASAARQPEPQTCPPGTRFTGGSSPSTDFQYIMPSGQTRLQLLFGFTDRSGIRSADVTIGYDPSLAPDPMLDIVDLPRHGGGTAQFYRWQFNATEPLRSLQVLSLDLTPNPNTLVGTILTLTATDGAGNTRTKLFYLLPHASACQ